MGSPEASYSSSSCPQNCVRSPLSSKHCRGSWTTHSQVKLEQRSIGLPNLFELSSFDVRDALLKTISALVFLCLKLR